MASIADKQRISQLQTKWDEIFAAHQEQLSEGKVDGSRVRSAQANVLARYGNCIFEYLLGATRGNHVVADELAQEFAYRFLRGDLSRAHPAKGRFRDYLKSALSNLVTDYFRRQQQAKQHPLPHAIESDPFREISETFNQSWRQRAIQQTWAELERFEMGRNNFYYTVLRLRVDRPDESSIELAHRLSDQLGQPVTSDWVRQKIHRARQKFATLLVAEVRKTVENDEQLNEELADLRLLKYLESSSR